MSASHQYLEAAAKILAKANAVNEAPDSYTNQHTRRIEIAMAYAVLGAVAEGILPQPMAAKVYRAFGDESTDRNRR